MTERLKIDQSLGLRPGNRSSARPARLMQIGAVGEQHILVHDLVHECVREAIAVALAAAACALYQISLDQALKISLDGTCLGSDGAQKVLVENGPQHGRLP